VIKLRMFASPPATQRKRKRREERVEGKMSKTSNLNGINRKLNSKVTWDHENGMLLFCGGWPSQWQASPFTDDEGKTFSCCEQYMMYHKARTFSDTVAMEKVMKTTKPAVHKRIGREVQNFDGKKWDSVCDGIVEKGNLLKYPAHTSPVPPTLSGAPFQGAAGAPCTGEPPSCGVRVVVCFCCSLLAPLCPERYQQNAELREELRATKGLLIVEASSYDKIWGIGMAASDPASRDPAQWPAGGNRLGKALMKVRDTLFGEGDADGGGKGGAAVAAAAAGESCEGDDVEQGEDSAASPTPESPKRRCAALAGGAVEGVGGRKRG